MIVAEASGIPDWIQALGVIAALGVAGYQLWQQRQDAKDSADRHEKAEQDAAQRHQREMVDRKRERLLTHYPVWSAAVEDYLMNMAVATELRVEAQKHEQVAIQKRDAKANEGAITLQSGAMQHHTAARAAMTRAVTAHLAIRFDDAPEYVERIDAHMEKVESWRGEPTEQLVMGAHQLVYDRSDALRPRK